MLLCSVGILRAVEYTVITSWVWWFTRMHRWCIVGTVFELVLCCFHWCHLLPCLPSCLQTTLTLSSSVTYSLRSPACSQCSSSLRTSFSAKRCADDNALYLYLLDCEVSLISYACLLHFVWAVAEAKCVVVTAVYVCVCLSLAAFQHYCTDPDVSWQNGRGCPVVLQYWVDLQSVHGFCCYGNIAPNAECQLVLVFAVCLVNTGASEENLWEKWCRIYISCCCCRMLHVRCDVSHISVSHTHRRPSPLTSVSKHWRRLKAPTPASGLASSSLHSPLDSWDMGCWRASIKAPAPVPCHSIISANSHTGWLWKLRHIYTVSQKSSHLVTVCNFVKS